MSVSHRLGSNSLFVRPNEDTKTPRRVVFLSTEGTKTEVNYFGFVEKYRNKLKIKSIVHVEVLRRHDTRSSPDDVLDLLEEYNRFRNENSFEKEISALQLKNYDSDFINTYLYNPDSLPTREKHKFEAVLKDEEIDLVYLDFLSRYHGEDDVFGLVIDRDKLSHTTEQMRGIYEKCKEKNYKCFISNPCIEFWLLLHVLDIMKEYKDDLDIFAENALDTKGDTFVSNLLCSKTGNRKAIQEKTFLKYYLPNVELAIERAKMFATDKDLIDNIGSNIGELFKLLCEE